MARLNIKIETGKTVIIIDTTGYKYQTFILGKKHHWNQLRRPHPISILRSGEFKFDGPCRDDQGNAQLKVSLRAWVEITQDTQQLLTSRALQLPTRRELQTRTKRNLSNRKKMKQHVLARQNTDCVWVSW